ncbi:MAG: sulfatase-like hydrolase/transferase [bacterium]|nr:sulfatase-like hydrolase/transferase [bacterium]MDZ4248350.1 sulfatase-like hydrolase/transferase [Patescibacteria group bacterium]
MKHLVRPALPTLVSVLAVVPFYTVPFLSFAKDNVVEGLPLDQAAGLFVVLVLLGLAVQRIAFWILKDWAKATILTVLVSFPILYFRTMVLELVKLLPAAVRPSLIIYPVVAVLLVGSWLIIRRLSPGRARTVTSYLAVVGILLFAYSFVMFGLAVQRNTGAHVAIDNADFRSTRVAAKSKVRHPDIYYLVFDRYTGRTGLSESFGYDNGPFLASLKRKGFYVESASFSNYPFTSSSLASSWNGGLLKTSGAVNRVSSGIEYYKQLKRPAAEVVLKRAGYRVTRIGSWWGATETSAVADENPRYAWEFNAFGRKLHVGNMAGVYLLNTVFVDVYEKLSPEPFRVEKRQGPIFHEQVATIEGIADREDRQPKFVLAHILMPHPPYVFDKDGSPSPDGLSQFDKYLRQLTYSNQEIGRLVDHLLAAHPDNPPVIVLTADEGEYPRRFDPKAKDAQLRQKTNILGAFYFPGQRYDSLYPTITPVNYFRVILNQYLGAHLTLQPDTIHTNNLGRPYVFYDITKRVHAAPGPAGSAKKLNRGTTVPTLP